MPVCTTCSPIRHSIVWSQAFGNSFLNIADTGDERTLILQMFVYISLFFTLLTIPFIELLRRELEQREVEINLGKRA